MSVASAPSRTHVRRSAVLAVVAFVAPASLVCPALASPARAGTPTTSVRLAGAHPVVREGRLYKTTVTVRYLLAGYWPSVWVWGPGTSLPCTPVIVNAARTTGTATCWRFAAKPGVAALHAGVRMVRGASVRRVSSPTWYSTVTRTTRADVSVATYNKTYRCGNTTSYVWLTFDDWGTPWQVTSILATLKRNNVKAHIFPIGTWAKAHPSLIAAMKRDGHIIDNHTWKHTQLTGISNAAVLTQIDGGARPSTSVKLLRPPWGSGAFTPRLTSLAASRGYGLCFWTVDTMDWAGASASRIVSRVRDGDATTESVQAGGVVLMHLSGRHTPAALQSVINTVRAKGLKLQPLRSTAH